jgi:hypothetical protein
VEDGNADSATRRVGELLDYSAPPASNYEYCYCEDQNSNDADNENDPDETLMNLNEIFLLTRRFLYADATCFMTRELIIIKEWKIAEKR